MIITMKKNHLLGEAGTIQDVPADVARPLITDGIAQVGDRRSPDKTEKQSAKNAEKAKAEMPKTETR